MSTELIRKDTNVLALNSEELSVIKRNFAKDATDVEFHMFMGMCRHLNLNPFKNEVYFAKIKGKVTVMVSINGLRNRAIETGLWRGRTIPLFCGRDGVWKEIWTENEPPFACKVGIKKEGLDEPQYAIAEWDAYARKYEGKPTGMWSQMGTHMLAKCAEALAIRLAFSTSTFGMYTHEEMQNVDASTISDKTLSEEQKAFIVQEIKSLTASVTEDELKLKEIRRSAYMHILADYKAGCEIEDIDIKQVISNYLT